MLDALTGRCGASSRRLTRAPPSSPPCAKGHACISLSVCVCARARACASLSLSLSLSVCVSFWQVKIRGFRIELGEVEAAACTMWDEPVEVTALVVEDELVLFVAAEAMRGKRRLRTHVARTLPKYMVPSRVVAVESFPRLVSGKINMGALRRGEHSGEVVESAFASQLPATALSLAQTLQPRSTDGVTVYQAPAVGLIHTLVADHVVLGRVVFPATGYLVMAHTAAEAAAPLTALRSTFFLQPLVFDSPEGFVECSVASTSFEVRSVAGASRTVHSNGMLARDEGTAWQRVQWVSARGSACARAAHVAATYDVLHAQGLEYGPGYRTLEDAWGSHERSGMALARLQARATQQGTNVHPADLDDALCLDQLLSIGAGVDSGETKLPFAVDDARLQAAAGELWAVRAFVPCQRLAHAPTFCLPVPHRRLWCCRGRRRWA